jgi:hypothetical protein
MRARSVSRTPAPTLHLLGRCAMGPTYQSQMPCARLTITGVWDPCASVFPLLRNEWRGSRRHSRGCGRPSPLSEPGPQEIKWELPWPVHPLCYPLAWALFPRTKIVAASAMSRERERPATTLFTRHRRSTTIVLSGVLTKTRGTDWWGFGARCSTAYHPIAHRSASLAPKPLLAVDNPLGKKSITGEPPVVFAMYIALR